MIPAFPGKVDARGRLIADDDQAFMRYLRAAFADQDVVITVRRAATLRSMSQNRYYHAVVIKLLAEHMGYRPDEMHTLIKQMFHVASTASLETDAFERLLEDIRAWAATDFGVTIPLPNEIVQPNP